MKFVSFKANGVEVFVNPAAVAVIASSDGVAGSSTLISQIGTVLEVDGSPSEVKEKLEGNDKPLF